MPQYPPAPPPGTIRRKLWEYEMKLTTTLGLSLVEPWERKLVSFLFFLVVALFWLSVFTYTPGHLRYLHRRFAYYVFDDETVDVGALIRNWAYERSRDLLAGLKVLDAGKEL